MPPLLRRLNPGMIGLTLACCAGVVIGIGTFTFDYGEGLSYFSTDPKNCANCHIMQEHYDSWQKAGHHQLGADGQHLATCVDCHLPHSGIAKYVAKADNGFRHSWAFTFQDFHEPIQIIERNSQILQDNCLRCHGDFVHNLTSGSTIDDNPVFCVHCHAGVGHGP